MRIAKDSARKNTRIFFYGLICEITNSEGRNSETQTMTIHPDALRILVRAMEKDLKQKKPAEPAQKGRTNETQIQDPQSVYHKPAQVGGNVCDRNDSGNRHDRNGDRRIDSRI